MGIVRLGKMHLRWCMECNLPILESEQCAVCGSPTKQVEMTPPGEARPGFDHDLNFVRDLLDKQFGPDAGILIMPKDQVFLMSKVPGIDKMEEVIGQGEVLGTLRYDLGKSWTFVMRMISARALQGVLRKGMVIADDGAVAPVLNSNNLMAPGVAGCADGIQKGDEVIIVDKQLRAIATGTAKMDSAEMRLRGKGVAVKTRWSSPASDAVPMKGGRTWDMAVQANQALIESKVAEAVKFVRDVMAKNHLPAAISFSGGKDSLACLLISRDAGLDLPVFFIDTGLEFPETVEYVRRMGERYHLNLIQEKAPENAFYGNLEYFGPPGRDYRWCCKTNKLGPTVNAIMKHFPGGVVSFIGQRRYESEQRAEKPRVWHNPWTPGQIGASPIQNWTALHVWLYIFLRKAPYNPWYEKGLDRIGCCHCPASDLAELEMISQQDGPLSKWDQYLRAYAEKRGLPENWVRLGLWRWRRVPPSVMEELVRNGIPAESLKRDEAKAAKAESTKLVLRMQEGFSPCIMGYSIEGAFSHELDLDHVRKVLSMAGFVEYSEAEGWATVEHITVFQEGALIGKGKEQERISEKIETVRRLVVKAEECVGCGVCVARCKEGALMLDRGRITVDMGKCIHCGECIEPCPAISFGDTTFEF